jgi:hypothetical protein
MGDDIGIREVVRGEGAMAAKLTLMDSVASDLINLTNSQFAFWAVNIRKMSQCEIPAGNNMNLWFILSRLAMEPKDDFSIVKNKIYEEIPNLKIDAVKKVVAFLHTCGFVETIKQKGPARLRLTEAGKILVQDTLNHWASKFSEVHAKLPGK